MKIHNLTHEKYKDFIKFNETIYSDRKNVGEYFEFNILNNPLLVDKQVTNVLVACNDTGQIIGQVICNSCGVYINRKYNTCFHCYDFFILKNYRKRGIGTLLIDSACKNNGVCIGIGITDHALNIDLSFGRNIGSIYQFIWFKDLQTLLSLIFKRIFLRDLLTKVKSIPDIKLPETISASNKSFTLINHIDNWEEQIWNEDIFQFARPIEFLQWRFFSKPGKYYFYLLNEPRPRTYFVVRKSVWRNLNILEIVDYRIPPNDKDKFDLILNCSKKLADEIKFDGIVVQSSLNFFDKLLKRKNFFKTGKPVFMICNVKTKVSGDNIKKRNFVYATMIDWMYRS